MIEFYSLLSSIILISTVLTVGFAVVSYFAFRIRETRKQMAGAARREAAIKDGPRFFKTYNDAP
jgi:hypothetical protein